MFEYKNCYKVRFVLSTVERRRCAIATKSFQDAQLILIGVNI